MRSRAPASFITVVLITLPLQEQQEHIDAPGGAVALLSWRYAEAVGGATRKLFQSLLDSHAAPQVLNRLLK